MLGEIGTVIPFGYKSTTLVASELDDGDRGYAAGPERALISALLFDGVQAYLNFMTASSRPARSRYREAFNWVHRRGEEYVFSFDSVCAALGIEPDNLRYGLVNIAQAQRTKFRRSRNK